MKFCKLWQVNHFCEQSGSWDTPPPVLISQGLGNDLDDHLDPPTVGVEFRPWVEKLVHCKSQSKKAIIWNPPEISVYEVQRLKHRLTFMGLQLWRF